MNEFKVGDIIRLKSGGEKMTIKHIGFPHEDQIQCQWFDNKSTKLECFYPEMLVHC